MSPAAVEELKQKPRKQWWTSNRKIAERYVKAARALMATQSPVETASALPLLEAAISSSPRHEAALELKARALLFLRRFKDVAEMLKDHIPSFKPPEEYSSTSSTFVSDHSQLLSRERVKLLRSDTATDGLRCFSVADLKEKLMRQIRRSEVVEGHWRYLVLGQACYHLGMMDDAIVLLQSGRRLAAVSLRRESEHHRKDMFAATAIKTELESAASLLSHVKLLVRRRSAAIAALDAHLPYESVRHFSKILDSRRAIPRHFAAGCFAGRASANRSAGRLADAIADCNRALTLDPSSIPALRLRSDVLESVRALPDCLLDLDHLKLLYDTVLRDGKPPGPAWRPHDEVRCRDVPACLRALNRRMQEMKQRVAKGERCCVDHYRLLGVKRGCSRAELERAHLILSLKHRPEKAAGFVERVELGDEYRDVETVRDQARMSALILHRMLHKSYASVVGALLEEEAAERKKAAATAATVATVTVVRHGAFCREMNMAVGAFGVGIPVNCEA